MTRSNSPCQRSYFIFDVDLTGSRLGPAYHSGRLVVDGTECTPARMRSMWAEHYEISLEQVGEPRPATAEDYEEAWG